jgi:hypothetical protein
MSHLANGLVDCVSIFARSNLRHPVHFRDSSLRGRDDICQANADHGVWPLADNDQWTIDNGNALCWLLKGLRLPGDLLDVIPDLSWSGHGDFANSDRA